MIEDYSVRKIERSETIDFIMTKHYAQRMPSVSFSFGLFDKNKMVGVCTIGKPASRSLCVGVCGFENHAKVYELNRLIVEEGLPKNVLSFFVSSCLKELKRESLVIVSYADSGMNHNGYIYQATNFIYTGKTVERTDKYMPGNKHSRHYSDEFKHMRKVRTSKHRYIYFTNNKDKELKSSLRYEIKEYPKGENCRYELGERIKTEVLNKETGERFYE